ncbi:E3 ubiquitin-protein ligase SINA-like 11 [Aegilops tauschii subsp. strangulata]|uniref:E3 ubiquitin-protein ligase SINA-like 11 n=1 Tax=Aegilops tauschii subsp. strangulata TaxID=200361 RepID=UPI003CC8A584
MESWRAASGRPPLCGVVSGEALPAVLLALHGDVGPTIASALWGIPYVRLAMTSSQRSVPLLLPSHCLQSLPHGRRDVVESIKVACSNGNHGCTARITYYRKEEHEKGCPHAPCFCPETGCSFSGSTARLLEHFFGKHKWHSPKVTYNKAFQTRFHLGSTVLVGEDGHLFLVNMTMEPLGGVISVCCVQPHFTGSKFKCRLAFSCVEPSYSRATEFLTRGTNLYDGFPKDCFPFLVLKMLLRGTGASTIAMMGVTVTPQ